MRSEKGFTLTELLVVIAIMAVLAMVTIPTVGPMFRDHALDSSIANVQGVIMKARSLAAMNRCNQYISFNTLKRTGDFLVIYSGGYYDAAGEFVEITTSQWVNYWNATGVASSFTKQEARKLLVSNPPVFLEKNTQLGLSADAFGNDSFLTISATGEVSYGGNFDQASGAGHNPYYNQGAYGVAQLKIMDTSDTSNPVNHTIGLTLLTGEFYSIED